MTKRAFDLIVVILAAPLWVPVLAVIFEVVKFRSMLDARDASGCSFGELA